MRSSNGALAALPALPGLLTAGAAEAQPATPLASWNDGPAKQAILDFIRTTTDLSSKSFVPLEERVATFDQDGTLWVEHPIYTQVVYCLDRVPVVVKEKPELAEVEPFKTVLTGDLEKIAKLPMHDLEVILAATLTGMDVDTFYAEAKTWIDTAKHPRGIVTPRRTCSPSGDPVASGMRRSASLDTGSRRRSLTKRYGSTSGSPSACVTSRTCWRNAEWRCPTRPFGVG